MKRLVYSPKAYCWVRTDNHGLVDLSPYIVSGSVARKVNMVSTAEITIRNPNMMFTRESRTKAGPYFKPMDPITVWLERIRGFPVQVFTGYLDQSPYLQLYPGTASLTASCTLKKLLHVYWDPALSFTQQFMAKYGWINNDGRLLNVGAESGQSKNQDNTKLQIMQDGSIGELLYAVLTEIADWPDKNIHIERLPDKLMEDVMNIYQVYNADAKEMRDQVQQLIEGYLGKAELGSGGLSGGADGGNATLKGGSNHEKAFNFFRAQGLTAVQAAGICGSLMGESAAMDPKISEIGGGGGYGIAQWTDAGRKAALFAWPNYDTLSGQLGFLWHEATTGPYASQVRQINDLVGVVNYWTTEYERPGAVRMAERIAFARDVYASFGKNSVSRDNNSTGSSVRPQTGTTVAGDTVNSNGKSDGKIYSPFGKVFPVSGAYGTNRGDHIHAGIDIATPCGTPCIAPFDGTVTYTSTSGFGVAGGMIHLRADKDVAGLNKGDKIGWGHISAVDVAAGKRVNAGDKIATSGGSPCHVHFVYITPGGGGNGVDGNADPTQIVDSLMKGQASSGNSAGGTPGGGGGASDSASAQEIITAAKSAAFVQELEFPGFMEMQEAMMLTGAKSLMNDKPLFPFVEQLSKAAMRSFQSLPNGDFYAFYPDYFGHMRDRQPYWTVEDIEILDAQIQLSDETLATHVFGVGDTNHLSSPGIDWFDRLFSTGVINISNIAISGFNPSSIEARLNDQGKAKDAKEKKQRLANEPGEVIAFLSKYGARPHVEEAPFIKSPFFEAFLAWQTFNLMWSRQFSTTCTFTFMPEIFPGGLIAFGPEEVHDLQVYVESVTHNFSYTDGFTTECEISAPATLSKSGNADDPLSFGLVRAGGA